jgi:hypothetical protein
MKKKVKPPEKSKLDSEITLAAAVSDRVQIQGIRLLSCNCLQISQMEKGKHHIELSDKVETRVEQETGFVHVCPRFRLRAFPDENVENEPSLVIEAVFSLSYKVENLTGLTRENFDCFGRMNGTYNAWPYWREFVHNVTARMGLPSLTLPVFRVAAAQRRGKQIERRRKTFAATTGIKQSKTSGT